MLRAGTWVTGNTRLGVSARQHPACRADPPMLRKSKIHLFVPPPWPERGAGQRLLTIALAHMN